LREERVEEGKSSGREELINGRVKKERVEEGKNWGRESQGREKLRGVKS
jgi:hypothetical protein